MRDLIRDLLYALALYGALTAAQRLLRRSAILRGIAFSLNLFFLLFAAKLFLQPHLARIHPALGSDVEAAFLCVAAYIALRLFDVLVFDHLVMRRHRRAVPSVVRDILRWLVFALATFAILRALFPTLNLNILAVSSLVVGYIVGNATQDTLGNLIAGLALNTDKPFALGDWVQIQNHIGQVAEMTWRATRLFTKTRDHVIIPNAVIAREPITNFSRPTCEHGVILPIGISYDTPPHKFRRVMSAILASVPGVLKDPKPCLWLDQYADFSINFRVKFYINDYDRLDEIRSAVMYLVWYHFQRAQIVIPFPIRDVRVTSAARPEERSEAERRREEYRRLIDGIDLFQPLAEEERRIVAENLREEVFAEGEPLVRQGDAGDTFYIVRDGRVIVTARRDGRDTVLAHLDAGGFFGEMSLLTGEPRSATVAAEEDTRVLELSSAVFSELLHRNARLAEDLAHRIETRRERYGEAMDAAAGPAPAAAPAPARAALVARIRRFFGLGPQA